MDTTQIAISVPWNQPEMVPIWAFEEERIDFRTEHERADRCTLCFAAMELKHYLERTLHRAAVAFTSPSANPADYQILLQIAPADSPADSSEGSYRMEAEETTEGGIRIVITGADRTGTLYGAYDLLHMQGWRWLEPGEAGETNPIPRDALTLPRGPVSHAPSFTRCRGFDFSFLSKESAQLLVWMARNHLNLASYRPATAALARKLGMVFRNGGHLFEPLLDPDRKLPSGRTVWEEHREWYGLPADGNRTKEQALRTQFCASQPALLDFLADELLRMINGPWREADIIAVWGFDTWGDSCTCDACRRLGNATDAALHVLSHFRQRIDEARSQGNVDHEVRLAGCAYEGTDTLVPPSRPVPQNLTEAGDYLIFYPIDRSYAFDLFDQRSSANGRYARSLKGWSELRPGMQIIIGEYYNVSKYEDLPLLFTQRMRNDMTRYHASGAVGMTYMHVPLVNWALRRWTQWLHARLSWDVSSDVDALQGEFLQACYGNHAEALADAYRLVEEAWRFVAEWRAWHDSVLSIFLSWDGTRPAKPLSLPGALPDAPAAIREGSRSIALLEQAMTLVARALRHEQTHPQDESGHYEWRLAEDRRLLLYGLDTMRLMTELTAYHHALYTGEEEEADGIFQRVEELADRMDRYWVPIHYEQPGPGLVSKDALTRTQLRRVLSRCRMARPVGHPGASEELRDRKENP